MKELAKRFCCEAERRAGLRYPSELKGLAIEYALAAEREGDSPREIAETLGLCEATLRRWRSLASTAALHEVKVVREGSLGPVLVMPSGVRVEGLILDELASLLAALG